MDFKRFDMFNQLPRINKENCLRFTFRLKRAQWTKFGLTSPFRCQSYGPSAPLDAEVTLQHPRSSHRPQGAI